MGNTQLIAEIIGASYIYQQQPALAQVSLTITRGSITVVVGRNGAGKSTLLRCMAGWAQVSAGDIVIMGESLQRDQGAARQHVLLVPDVPPLYDDLTAWEHLQFIAQVHRIAGWERQATMLLQRFGLWRQREAYPWTFSRGMRYKLAVCIALLVAPALMLFDEPFSPLDPVSADALWHALEALRQAGHAVVLSTHQLPPHALPDHYYLLDAGQIVAHGNADELRKQFTLSPAFLLDELLHAALPADGGPDDDA